MAIGEVVPKVGNRAMSGQFFNGLAAGENSSTSPTDPILELGNIVPGVLTPVLAKKVRVRPSHFEGNLTFRG